MLSKPQKCPLLARVLGALALSWTSRWRDCSCLGKGNAEIALELGINPGRVRVIKHDFADRYRQGESDIRFANVVRKFGLVDPA